MKEQYLFRGKRVDNGEWAVGLLATCRKYLGAEWEVGIADGISTSDVQHFSYRAIDPATVGRCTGLRDKNGTLIFSGDVCVDNYGREFSVVISEYFQQTRLIPANEMARTAYKQNLDNGLDIFTWVHPEMCLTVTSTPRPRF